MGIAKTNVSLVINSTSGGSGIPETLPTVLASCSAASGNAKADISWEYTNTDYVAGMRICYKTGSYPENAEDGAYVDIEGAETLSATITGIENNVAYYFRLFPYNENGDYQASVTNALCECIPTAITVVAGTATVETGVTEDGMTGYAIISSSGTFDIIASGEQEITAYLVGGGGNGVIGHWTSSDVSHVAGGSGGAGGYVTTLSVMSANGTLTDTATIASVGSTSGTNLTHDGTVYKYNSGTNFSRNGGTGASHVYGTNNGYPVDNSTESSAGTDGISVLGYGFVGSSGGGGHCSSSYPGSVGGVGAGSGVSGDDINAVNYGCGGGGGAAPLSSSTTAGNGGAGMQGCIILNWAL